MPDPIAPEDLVVRWRDAAGTVVEQATVRALLPMAIAPGAQLPIRVRVAAPAAAGRYPVDVARAAEPERAPRRRPRSSCARTPPDDAPDIVAARRTVAASVDTRRAPW